MTADDFDDVDPTMANFDAKDFIRFGVAEFHRLMAEDEAEDEAEEEAEDEPGGVEPATPRRVELLLTNLPELAEPWADPGGGARLLELLGGVRDAETFVAAHQAHHELGEDSPYPRGGERRQGKPEDEGPRLPAIIVAPGELAGQVDAAKRALTDTYQRGGVLVRTHRVESADPDARDGTTPAGNLKVIACSAYFTRQHLARCARWLKYDGRRKRHVPVDPPEVVARAVLEPDWPANVPTLAGVTRAPVPLPDGSLITAPGYHPATGLLLDPDGCYPAVPAEPTADDARMGLARLREAVGEFPFASPEDEAAALTIPFNILTAPTLRAVPGVAVDSTAAGSGKSLLCSALALIATGAEPPRSPQAGSDEEERKSVFARLLEGHPVLMIDNVTRPVGSAAIAQAITEPAVHDRILGASRTAEMPARVAVLLTGNGLIVAGDLTRRVIITKLDAGTERPERRSFRRELLPHVRRHRPELLAACLTILRAYQAAGRPLAGTLPPFGGFESWSQLVREPLVWLGLPDPLATQERLRDCDPDREDLAALLRAMHAAFGDDPVTVQTAVAAATNRGHRGVIIEDERLHLLAALRAVAGEESGEVNHRRLGRYFSRYAGACCSGLKILRRGRDLVTYRWRFAVVRT